MDPVWIVPFLHELTTHGNISKAALIAGIGTSTVSARRKTDADFAAAFEQALEDYIDVCEGELDRRAFGYEELVVHQGQPSAVWERDAQGEIVAHVVEYIDPETGGISRAVKPKQARNPDGSLKWLTVKKHSDTLLLAKVKAYRKRYSTERTELTGADGGAVVLDEATRNARLLSILELAKARRDFGDLA